jgi:DNA-directed RNA polymerase specialized sigma24 family protein
MDQIKTNSEKMTASDYELLVLMSWKDDPDYGKEAREAFSTFYEKHRYYFVSAIRKKCESLSYQNKDEIVNELFNDVFKRIYEKAETICRAMEKHQYKTDEEFRKVIRAYLGEMAKHEMIRYLKSETEYQKNHDRLDGIDIPEPFFSDVFDDQDGEAEGETGDMAKLAKEALQQLKPMERDILITSITYYDPRKDLPDAIIREICDKWGITAGHMRVVICRAKKKFTEFIMNRTGMQPVPVNKKETERSIYPYQRS